MDFTFFFNSVKTWKKKLWFNWKLYDLHILKQQYNEHYLRSTAVVPEKPNHT